MFVNKNTFINKNEINSYPCLVLYIGNEAYAKSYRKSADFLA